MERRTVIVPGIAAGGNIGAGANDSETPPPMQPRAPPNSAASEVSAASNEGQDMAVAARERQARFDANMAVAAQAEIDERARLDAAREAMAALADPQRERLNNRIHRH